jgi:hypothetical protein
MSPPLFLPGDNALLLEKPVNPVLRCGPGNLSGESKIGYGKISTLKCELAEDSKEFPPPFKDF